MSGPSFTGDEVHELSASHSPFNMKNNCYSRAEKPGYMIGIEGNDINMLTRKEDGYFRIKELEVW